jgi:transcriptional regulator with XRE-family HTH domain
MTIAIRCRTYQQVVGAFAARRRELRLTQLAADERSGLQSGYVSKLECGDRHFGPVSLPMLCAAYDVDIVVMPRTAVAPAEPRPGSCGLVHHLNRGDPS